MTVYTFDRTMDGLLTAVFDAFNLKEEPAQLLAEGDALPLFCEHIYHVTTDEEKARRVWTGLEKRLSQEVMRLNLGQLAIGTARAEYTVVPIYL